MRKNKMNPFARQILYIGLLVCAISFFNGKDKIANGDLEQAARQQYHIGENWDCAKQIDNRMGALLFYDESTNAHRFLLYIKNMGLQGGYKLVQSDTSAYIQDGIEGYAFQQKGMVLFSMNTVQIREMRVTSQQGHTTIIPVDAWNPFAVILPENATDVVLYDRADKEVPISNINVYEKE